MGNVNALKGFTRGQIDAALMQIGQDAQMETAEAITAFLAGKLKVVRVWQVLQTIKLGTGLKTTNTFRESIKNAGYEMDDLGDDILGKDAFIENISPEEMEVDLVVATPGELGFGYETTYPKIYARAVELGLDLCPAEVGPQLRLQYPNQPRPEYLNIAMKPIVGSDERLRIFRVGHASHGTLYLDGSSVFADKKFGVNDPFVFWRKRK